MNNNLSLLKIINGLSRTINIANQMLPLYNQIKPIILKGNELLSNINLPKSQPETTQNNISKETQQKENTSLPTFFQ
jgi:hypothetical protein